MGIVTFSDMQPLRRPHVHCVRAKVMIDPADRDRVESIIRSTPEAHVVSLVRSEVNGPYEGTWTYAAPGAVRNTIVRVLIAGGLGVTYKPAWLESGLVYVASYVTRSRICGCVTRDDVPCTAVEAPVVEPATRVELVSA